jgi:hypothetical protein
MFITKDHLLADWKAKWQRGKRGLTAGQRREEGRGVWEGSKNTKIIVFDPRRFGSCKRLKWEHGAKFCRAYIDQSKGMVKQGCERSAMGERG